jgi:hypothetical protein
MVKAEDGSMVTLLVSKSAAGRATPKDATDIFGVVVKNGGEWRLMFAADRWQSTCQGSQCPTAS